MRDSLEQRALISNLRLFALAVIGALIVGAVAMVVRGQAGAVAMLGTATPTSTATATPTWTATATPTPTATATATSSPTPTATASPTPTVTARPADARTPASPTRQPVTPSPTSTPGTPTPTPTPVPRTVLVTSLDLPDASTAQDHFRFARPFDDRFATWGSSYYPFGTNARGQYLWHQGMDIQNPYGTPIRAVGDGVVVRAGPDDKEPYGPRPNFFGQAVLVQHHEPWNGLPVFTLYGHVSRILVRVGESVTTGQVIAEVGQGGVALGPHLHLEVRVGSADYRDARNPYLWVTPDPGYGVIAGRVIDAQGYVVPQQLVLLSRASEPNRYWRETFTYPDNIVKSDPAWGELFAFGDIPVGAYVVKTRFDGKLYTQAITVTDRATTFVVFDGRQPAVSTPAAHEDTPSSE